MSTIVVFVEHSEGTVKRDWAVARAWLRKELGTTD